MSAAAVENICDHSDLPRWLCPHCPDFAAAPRPVPPEPVRGLAGYWTIPLEPSRPHTAEWRGLVREPGKPPRPAVIHCNHDDDQPLCHDCTEQLGLVLDDVPDVIYQLHVAEVRDSKFVEHGKSADDDGNLNEGGTPWNERAVQARRHLVTQIREAAAATQQTGRSVAALTRAIRANLGRLARRRDMPEWASRISQAVADAHHVIDTPGRRWYYGKCPKCGKHIYAERSQDPATLIACPDKDCGYGATLEQHQRAQLNAGEDRWLTIDELVGAIAKAGEDGEVVTRRQIEHWIRHDGLPRETRTVPRFVDGTLISETVDVYRLGDVRAMAEGEYLRDTWTTVQVAESFGVSEEAVRQWVNRRQLEPVRRKARPLRFRLSDVEEFRASRGADVG